jgi:hypothetical protein
MTVDVAQKWEAVIRHTDGPKYGTGVVLGPFDSRDMATDAMREALLDLFAEVPEEDVWNHQDDEPDLQFFRFSLPLMHGCLTSGDRGGASNMLDELDYDLGELQALKRLLGVTTRVQKA